MAAWVNILAQLLSSLWSILSFPLRFVWAILGAIFGFALTLCAPAFYLFSIFLSCCQSIIDFIVSLEVSTPSPEIARPSGLTKLFIASIHLCEFVPASLEMGAANPPQIACAAFIGIIAGIVIGLTSGLLTNVLGMHDQPKQEPIDDYSSESASMTPLSSTPTMRSSRADDSSSFEDWMLLDSIPRSRRKRSAGLVTQTILEETDPEVEF